MRSSICLFLVAVIVCIYGFEDQYLNQDRAQSILLLTYSSYCDQSSIQKWDCFWCKYDKGMFKIPTVNNTMFFQANGIFGYAGTTADQIVVVFRGTLRQSLSNWLTDLTYDQVVPFHEQIIGAKAHDGFVEGYGNVADQVRSAVDALTKMFPEKPILFTGHSLGAALATLAAVDTKLSKRYKNPTLLWTVGSPRVGNQQLANYINENFPEAVRMTNRRDPVPRLPLVSLSYAHAGREYYSANGTAVFTRCRLDNNREDPNCIDSLWPWQVSFDDHLHYMGLNKRQGC